MVNYLIHFILLIDFIQKNVLFVKNFMWFNKDEKIYKSIISIIYKIITLW